jgi:hypothetical protein
VATSLTNRPSPVRLPRSDEHGPYPQGPQRWMNRRKAAFHVFEITFQNPSQQPAVTSSTTSITPKKLIAPTNVGFELT